jgi:hypothetical protein
MGIMDLRQFLANLTKYRGQLKIDPAKVDVDIPIGFKPDGTPINPHDELGHKIPGPTPKRYYASGTAATAADITTQSDVITEVLTLQAGFKVDATVADRTCRLLIPELGLISLAASSPTTLFAANSLTLSASEYGYIINVGGIQVWLCDNGTVTTQSSASLLPGLWVGPSAVFRADITANAQAGDLQDLWMICREYPFEDP